MDASLAVAIIAVAVSIVGPLLARRDIVSKLEEWKEGVDERLNRLEQDLRESKVSVLENRVQHCEKLIQELRDWKHNIYPKEYAQLQLLVMKGGPRKPHP